MTKANGNNKTVSCTAKKKILIKFDHFALKDNKYAVGVTVKIHRRGF